MTPSSSLLSYLRHCKALPPVASASDAELLRRYVQQRDEHAFTALVARHGPMVLHTCRRIVSDSQAAEDAFQATFLVLARRASRIRDGAALAGWLHAVACRSAWKARRNASRLPALSLPCEPADPRPDPLAQLSARELLAVIDEEVQRLPSVYRLPVILCCLQGRTQEEAARQLGWTPGSLQGRLERGRARLRTRLTRRGLTLTAVLAAVELSRQSGMLGGLLAATVRAADAAARGVLPSGASSAPAVKLAEEALRGFVAGKIKGMLGMVLLLGMIATGVSIWAQHWSVESQPASSQILDGKAEQGGTRQVQTAAQKPEPRRDRYGDPLPDGAVARIGTDRLQGTDRVYAAAYSSDGKLLATGLDSAKARLWDAKSGKLLLEMPLAVASKPGYGPSSVTTLAISPDGKRLAFGGYWSPSVCLWDVQAARLLHTFDNWAEGWENMAFVQEGPTLVFTPDGRTLVGGARDGSVRLWDVETGREQARLTGPTKAILGMGLSANGKTLLTADYYGKANLWDLVSRKHLRSFDTPAERQHSFRLAPDGQTFAYTTADGVIVVRDTAKGKERHRLPGDAKILGLAYTPESKALLTAAADGVVTAWDVRTGQKRKVAACRLAGPSTAIAPSGPHGAWLSPDGRALAWAVVGTLRLWDLVAGVESPRLQGHRSAVGSVGFSVDGHSLVTTSFTGEVGGWEAATGAARHPIRAWLGWGSCTRLSADRRRAVSVSGETGRTRKPGPGEATVFLWEPLADRPPVRLQGQTGPAYHAAFTPDGRSVIATHHDGSIGVYEAATGKLVRTFKGAPYLYYPTFAPDGATFVTLASDSMLRLWDFRTGRQLRSFPSPPVAQSLAFSPDGKVIATGHQAHWMPAPGGGMVLSGPGDWLYLWQAASGKQMQQVLTAQHRVGAVEFSPSGRLIATGGGDGTVRLWEAVSGLERRRLSGHRYGVNAVAFAPDGRRLASGSDDGTALVWEVFDPARLDPSEAELVAWWDDLAGGPAKAHRAIGALAVARSVAGFLAKRLKAVEAPGQQRLARLIADLDGERFGDREEATKELQRLHELARPALRQALTAQPSVEAWKRINRLLQRLEKPLEDRELLQAVRAVEVLELAGTEESRRLLRSLAEGAPEARLTQEARAALNRLGSRSADKP
jgi:RNA polymerase sigma factor (sigma-70 family)